MPLRRVAFAIALLTVALDARHGAAGFVPWSYQWSAQPIVLDADPLGPDHKRSGGITLTPGAITLSGTNPSVALGDANIVAVHLTAFAFSPRPDGKPYSFTNSPYHLGITLTDVASDQSGTLYFAGVFNGDFTDRTMDLHMHFTSATQQSLVLGDNRYTVRLTTYTPPEPPAEGGQGDINAFVSVQPTSAPEPSTLFLASVVLAVAAFSGLRRWIFP